MARGHSNYGIATGSWNARTSTRIRVAASSVVRLAKLERHLVEFAAQLFDARAILIASAIFGFDLDLFGRLLAEITDGQASPEDLVAADLELGLVFGRKIVADRLEVTDQVVERGELADVDEVLDASRHGKSLSGGTGTIAAVHWGASPVTGNASAPDFLHWGGDMRRPWGQAGFVRPAGGTGPAAPHSPVTSLVTFGALPGPCETTFVVRVHVAPPLLTETTVVLVSPAGKFP